LLEYMHFPFHALRYEKGDIPKECREDFKRYLTDAKMYRNKYERGLWKLYFRLWLKLYDMIARDNPFEVADAVIANSKYIARLVKILWGGDALILNPPVKVGDFKPYSTKTFEERDKAVVMIGRISPEKKVENAIDAIALTDTKPILRVVGGLTPTTTSYKERLERRAKKKDVKVEFHPNISRDELVRLATSSKLFIHTTVGEHFGIAVVEGMAAGCPVIVHHSGGPYEDITDYGRYGIVYEDIRELAERIDRLLADEKLWKHYHEKSLKRAPMFSEEKFAKKLLKVVEGTSG